MQVEVKYFGKLTDSNSSNKKLWQINHGDTLENLMNCLYEKYPPLISAVYSVFLNDRKTINYKLALTENDNIILMPPFAGG